MLKRRAFKFFLNSLFLSVLLNCLVVLVQIYMAKTLSDIFAYAINGETDFLITHGIIFVMLMLFLTLITNISGMCIELYSSKRVLAFRQTVFDAIIENELILLEKIKTGSILHRLRDDFEVICNTHLNTLPRIIGSLIAASAYFIWLSRINFFATISIFLVGCIPIFIPIILKQKFKQNFDNVQNAEDVASSYLLETINGNQTIKTMGLFRVVTLKYMSLQNSILLFGNKTEKSILAKSSISEGIKKLSTFSIYGILAYFVFNRHITSTDVIPMLLLSNNATMCISIVFNEKLKLAESEVSYKRLTEITEFEIADSEKILIHDFSTICFDDVSFSYIEQECVFENISFLIKKGDKIVLEGPNGSGKTTLIKLLLNLYQPYSGDILIDSDTMRSINKASYSTMISWVPQESVFFHETVAENLEVNDLVMSDQLQYYMRKFNLSEDILSKKIDELSGGQQKKVGLIRGLLRESALLILDEPSNYLDEEGIKALRSIVSNSSKTVIIVSHDHFWDEIMDRHLLIDEKKVKEKVISDYSNSRIN